MRSSFATRAWASVIVLLALSLAAPLTGATRTWTGTTDGNWMTATNWGGTAPVAGDDLVFPAAGANQANTNNFPAFTSFNSLSFSGGAYTLNGNAVTLGAGGIVTTGGTTHSILLPITLGASQTWILGAGSSATNLSATNLNGMAADHRKLGKYRQQLGRPNQWNRQHYTQQQ